MTTEEIRLTVDTPEALTIPRRVEVACGNSYVTLRQIMGRHDEWTVYEADARGQGLQGAVDHAPRAASFEELQPWAADLVTRRERARLAMAALHEQVDGQPRAEGQT